MHGSTFVDEVKHGANSVKEATHSQGNHLFCFVERFADGAVVVAKTGMGSSAALISSLVGALLSFFGKARFPCDSSSSDAALNVDEGSDGPDSRVNESLDLTHNLAQACHCVAQGKVDFQSYSSMRRYYFGLYLLSTRRHTLLVQSYFGGLAG